MSNKIDYHFNHHRHPSPDLSIPLIQKHIVHTHSGGLILGDPPRDPCLVDDLKSRLRAASHCLTLTQLTVRIALLRYLGPVMNEWCPPPNLHVDILRSSTLKFGDRAFKDVIKLK